MPDASILCPPSSHISKRLPKIFERFPLSNFCILPAQLADKRPLLIIFLLIFLLFIEIAVAAAVDALSIGALL